MTYKMKDTLPFKVGGLLYTPAINSGIAEKIINKEYECLTSMAFCLEDAIMDNAIEQAENKLIETLDKIYTNTQSKDELPLLFVRVRTPEHLKSLSSKTAMFSDILTGYILPKFDMSNANEYLEIMSKINGKDKRIYAMPILESAPIANKTTRMHELSQLSNLLLEEKEMILNVRVGGNDFCNLYGLRRSITQTIYDIGVVRDIFTDIINVFAQNFILSAPVWEYFGTDDTDKWAQGLKAELSLDKVNGFIGKTAVHPSQIPLINNNLRVSAEDYNDALTILNWDNNSFGVSKSEGISRMNEVKCHEHWAYRIKTLGDIYGIKESVNEKLI